jgi:hypothetical protein
VATKHSEKQLNVFDPIRMHRRVFLRTGLGAAAIGTLPSASGLAFSAEHAPLPALAVIDGRFAQANAYGRAIASRGVETLFFAGDLTRLWSDALDLRWRARPIVTSGVTTAGALHCLQFLAAGYRMQVHEQVTIETQSLQDPLVAWVLAPLPQSMETF